MIKKGKIDITDIGAKYFTCRTRYKTEVFVAIPFQACCIKDEENKIYLELSIEEKDGVCKASLPFLDSNGYVVWKEVGELLPQKETITFPSDDISSDDLEF